MPFSSLPKELFVQIIKNTFHQFDPSYSAQLQNARLVCKQWNEIIEDSPSLWTFISSRMHLTRIRETLHFSKSHDLTISVSVGKEELWELIFPHSSRWARVEIYGVHLHEGFMEKVRSAPAPRLTTLVLRRCDDEVAGAFGGKLPRLEELELHAMPCPWTPTNFPFAQLKCLRLIQYRFQSSHDIFQIFEILRSCTGLVTFQLGVPGFPLPHLPQSLVPAPLPRLTELLLQGMRSELLCLILQTLHIPNCRSVTIQGDDEPPEVGFTAVGHAVQSNGWGQIRETRKIEIVEPVRLQLDLRRTRVFDSVALNCFEA